MSTNPEGDDELVSVALRRLRLLGVVAMMVGGIGASGCGMRFALHHPAPRAPKVPAVALAAPPAAKPAAAVQEPRVADRVLSEAQRLGENGDHRAAAQRLELALADSSAHAAADREALLAALALEQRALGAGDAAEKLAALPAVDLARSGVARVALALDGPDDARALALAQAVVRARPHDAAALTDLGVAQMRTGAIAEAQQSFRAAIARDPQLAAPYYDLALLAHHHLYDDAQAAQWFSAYRERASADPDRLAETLAPALAGMPQPKDAAR